ncbi:MAG: metal-dependent transcriptional regulator [Thermanaerothrix sp.]|nr:metal-dependent transcriptional regulator [Thermanaerothrix sp.]
MWSKRSEDYLEEMFLEEMAGRMPSVTGLAKALEVTKGTVVSVLKKLCAEGLLEHERYGNPSLTEEGRKRALSIYRRHQELAHFFRLLGVEAQRAQQVACEMEHLLDDQVEMRLLALSDYICEGLRNGESWALELKRRLESPLDLPHPMCLGGEEKRCRVVRITAEGALRKRLLEMGMVPGTGVELKCRSWGEDPLEVEVLGRLLGLRSHEARCVWVSPVSEG